LNQRKQLKKVFMIIPLSQQILEKMLEIDVFLSKRDEKLDFRDIAIGASAIVEDLVLVSGNISHFERKKKLGLKFSPQNKFLNNLKNVKCLTYLYLLKIFASLLAVLSPLPVIIATVISSSSRSAFFRAGITTPDVISANIPIFPSSKIP